MAYPCDIVHYTALYSVGFCCPAVSVVVVTFTSSRRRLPFPQLQKTIVNKIEQTSWSRVSDLLKPRHLKVVNEPVVPTAAKNKSNLPVDIASADWWQWRRLNYFVYSVSARLIGQLQLSSGIVVTWLQTSWPRHPCSEVWVADSPHRYWSFFLPARGNYSLCVIGVRRVV